MNKLIAAAIVVLSTIAVAQECLVTRTPQPTKATHLEVDFLNPDGGARPCTGKAFTPDGRPPTARTMPNTDCDRLKKLGDWAVQQDNGWADGGPP